MASDIFLKVHAFPGEDLTHQLDHQLIKLGTDFDRVGDAFTDLVADALNVSEHKHIAGVKYEALIKHDVDTIGSDFVKLGDGFIKLDDAFHKFDDAFLNFADQFIKFTPGNVETDQGTIKLSDDFFKLDTDLKLTGADSSSLGLDFLKLHDTQTLAADFVKLGDSLSGVSDDFHKLGADFKVAEINLGAIKLSESDAFKIDEALHKIGTDDTTIGNDFHKVSADFLQIALDFKESSGGDQPSESLSLDFANIAIKFSEHFQQLETDTLKLDLDLKLVGDDYIKLANALPAVQEPPGPVNDPGIPDSLHQLLQLVHSFSLL